jgi:hypothetical protein
MKLLDTVAIIGFLDPDDKLHKRASEHIRSVSTDNNFCPADRDA